MTTFTKILAPVDFSDACRAALREIADLAVRGGTELILLYVLEETDRPVQHVLRSSSFPNVREEFRKGALAHLESFRDEVLGDRVPTRLLVREGTAAAEVVDAATELGVEAIAMATHGRTGLSRLLLGSTTERVMRTAGCPVFVVRDREGGHLGSLARILVPTDFSERSADAISEAVALTRGHGAELVLLHSVVPLPWPVAGATQAEGFPVLGGELRRAAQERLQAFRGDRIPSDLPCRLELTEGPAAEAILRFAETERVDLVAMASEGYGSLKRFLLGTTTEKVVRHAPCTVLVARPRE